MGRLNKYFYANQSAYVDGLSSGSISLSDNLSYDGWKRYSMVGFNMDEIRSVKNTLPSYAKTVLNLYCTTRSNPPDIGKLLQAWDESTLTYDNRPAFSIIHIKTSNSTTSKNTWMEVVIDNINIFDTNCYGLALGNSYADTSAPSGYFASTRTTNNPFITFTWDDVSITDFDVTNVTKMIYDDTVITLLGEHITRWDIYNNGNKVASNVYVIPKEKLVVGENKIFVRAYDNYGGVAESKVISIKLSTVSPTISNLVIENERLLIDDYTTLTWQSTLQEKVNIYNNDKLLMSFDGTVTMAIIAKGKLVVGTNRIKVEVVKNGIAGVVNSDTFASASTSVTLKRINPSISDLLISDTNIDNIITASWKSENQSRFALYQNARLVVSGTTQQSIEIDKGSLAIGSTILKVIVYYDSGFDTVVVEEALETVLKKNTPIIYNLEPSNLNINIDEMVTVTFETNEFCDRWELIAGGLNTKGTNVRSVSFGKDIFVQGNNELNLKIYYSPEYNQNEIRTAIKSVKFNGYGTPNSPIMDGNTIYATATPNIFWKADGQVEYHLLVIEEETQELVEEKKIITTDLGTTIATLENNKTYEIHLSIKNKYGIWSEYAIKKIETHFNEIVLPNFALFESETSVYITINGIQDINFKTLSIYRKTQYDNTWLEIADQCNVEDNVIDYTCPANTELSYKIRVYDKNGAYRDSEIKTIKISLLHYILTNVENADQIFRLINTSPSFDINNDFVQKVYAGARAPRIFKGKTNYKTASLKVTLKNIEAIEFVSFIDNSNDYNLFCLRDRRGEKLFVIAQLVSITPYGYFKQVVSLNLIEVNFKEKRMYSGSGYKKLTYLNGEYSLDGSTDLSGVDENATV